MYINHHYFIIYISSLLYYLDKFCVIVLMMHIARRFYGLILNCCYFQSCLFTNKNPFSRKYVNLQDKRKCTRNFFKIVQELSSSKCLLSTLLMCTYVLNNTSFRKTTISLYKWCFNFTSLCALLLYFFLHLKQWIKRPAKSALQKRCS